MTTVAETRPVERREVHYSGQVQGVGFRYTTRNIAQQFHVTGYVRNLRNGSVEVIVEGEADELDRFLADLQERMRNYLREVQVDRTAATQQFEGFEIRF